MSYIQGFVIPARKDRRDDYRRMCERMDSILMEYGATRIVECWGEDVPEGKLTDFRRAVQAQPDENVVFSWIVWPDRATCDAAASKLQSDERMPAPAELPFDMQRMIFGGFSPLFDSEA